MLMDVLGIAIGFSTVMLFLSLIVTALVQSTLAVFQLRGRVLRTTLARLLASDDKPDKRAALGMMAQSVGQTVKDRRFDSIKHLGCSAISQTQFASGYLTAQPNALEDETPAPNLEEAFNLMEDLSSARFSDLTRYISIFWAILIAGVFQVSSPDLITRLAQDETLRAQYIQVGERMILEEVIPSAKKFELRDAAVRAKAKLARKYPDLTAALDNPIGFGDSIDSLLVEMEIAIEGVASDAEPVLAAYETFLYEEVELKLSEYREQALSALGELSLLDIRPWRSGASFYWNKAGLQLSVLFGVLITSMFLTFGAPFWYQRLKDAADLRDSLAKRGSRSSGIAGQGSDPRH